MSIVSECGWKCGVYFEDGGFCGVIGFDFDGDIVKEFRVELSEE